MGLNKEYNHFVASIDMTPMQELTVDYVVTRMLNEETQYTVIIQTPHKPWNTPRTSIM
jgi:hypothetical protein